MLDKGYRVIMQKTTQIIDKILSNVLIFLMGAIVLTVTWQVITRFLMAQPSSYTEELARFLLIWIGLLGASWAVRTKAHLGIDLISANFELQGRKVISGIVYTIVLLFAFLIMVIGGLRLVNMTFVLNQTSAAMGIRMGYIYSVIPLSGALIIYYSAAFIIDLFGSSTEEETEKG